MVISNVFSHTVSFTRYCRLDRSIVNDSGISTLFRSRSENIPSKCGIIPFALDCPSLLAGTPGCCLNKTFRRRGAAVRSAALRPSVVFPDFCVPQVMRARDLPHAYALLCSRFCCWPFQCLQGTLSRSDHCELRGSRSSGEAWES